MKKINAISAFALLFAVILAVPMLSVKGVETWPLIWQGDVLSTGELVTGPVLEAGRDYHIRAQGSFIASMYGVVYFAIDAQYYTAGSDLPNPSDTWIWDPTKTFPAPGGHSFLQVNGMDVSWGPFSNGQPPSGSGPVGHDYTITYTGTGAPVTFAIVDWTQPYWPTNVPPLNHWCHLHVWIYEGPPPPPPPPAAETAYAYGNSYAHCFLSLGFNNWGWTNGPLGPGSYNFKIYAGAGQCNLAKGTLVGKLTINYDGSTATITYLMNGDWNMMRTQLYVGSEMLPRNVKGDFTVAPGQYPYIHDPVANPGSDTYVISGLSGNIYVIAHADVFET